MTEFDEQHSPALPASNSAMREMFKSYDWASSRLGPRTNWPLALKVMVNTMLASPVPTFLVWKTGSVHLYNDAFLSTLGRRHPEAFGQTFNKVWGKAWPTSSEMVAGALAGAASLGDDVRVRLSREKDEPDTFLTFAFCPIADENDITCGVECVVRDTTDSVKSRDDQRSQIQTLNTITRLAPGFIALFSDRSHIIVMANDAYMELVGHRNVVGKPLAESIPEAVEQGFVTSLNEVFNTGIPALGKAVRYEGRDRDGKPRIFFVDYVFQPIRDETGEITGIFLQGNDVTESVYAHQALQNSELELRQLANTISQLAWIASADGHIYWYNDRWFEYTGKSLDEMQGWGWTSVHHSEEVERVKKEWTESLASGMPFESTFPILGKDGNYRTFFTRAAPLVDETGRITKWFGTNTDVTSIDDAKRDLENTNRRKDEFLAMLAHELRNPLAPVTIAAQLLRMGTADPARVKKASEIISRQVKHMTSLIDDLLDVSRVTRGLVVLKPELLDIREIILPAVEQAHPLLAAKYHRFVLQIPDEPIRIRVDRARLIQVVSNILNNAAKYTNDNGTIILEVGITTALVTISVNDDGIGIDADLMPHIFDLFSQGERSSDRSQGGLGLGLALVKSLAELSGGTVTARSSGYLQGTTFEVTLPLAVDEMLTLDLEPDVLADFRQGSM